MAAFALTVFAVTVAAALFAKYVVAGFESETELGDDAAWTARGRDGEG